MLMKMAFRNIFRHKKRTVLTLITMIFGIFLSSIGDGINQGLQHQSIETFIRTDTAIYKVFGDGFYEDKSVNDPLEYLIKNESEIKNILEGKNYSSQLVFKGSVSTGVDELGASFIGVNPDEEDRVFNRKEKTVLGDFLETDGVVIGSDLAELLGIKLGDYVTILGRTIYKTVNAYDVMISGIIKTGNPMIDSGVVFLNIDFAREFSESEHPTAIAVMDELDSRSVEEINKLGAEAISYEEEIVDLMAIIKIRKRAFALITSLILSMAGIGIVNTMLMSMLERRKEVGIMMANGMNRVEVLSLFLYEGLIVGVIGSSMGSALALWFNIYYEINGIPLPIEVDTLGINLPISERLYTYFDIRACIAYLLLGIIISALASVYPAWKASKLNPADAVRV